MRERVAFELVQPDSGCWTFLWSCMTGVTEMKVDPPSERNVGCRHRNLTGLRSIWGQLNSAVVGSPDLSFEISVLDAQVCIGSYTCALLQVKQPPVPTGLETEWVYSVCMLKRKGSRRFWESKRNSPIVCSLYVSLCLLICICFLSMHYVYIVCCNEISTLQKYSVWMQ